MILIESAEEGKTFKVRDSVSICTGQTTEEGGMVSRWGADFRVLPATSGYIIYEVRHGRRHLCPKIHFNSLSWGGGSLKTSVAWSFRS